jgi:soluble lytic murein transglycosylase
VLGEDRYIGARRDGLFDPKQNVEIGARYIRYLLEKEAVNGGLFRLAIAYNAGIGNLIRWRREIKDNDDPLLFIESIPSRETRVFVERVLANYWIYRDRMGQPAPSRDDVAQGRWPIYAKQE